MNSEEAEMKPKLGEVRTFSELLSICGIEIPLIQRDYVQGRVHGEEIDALKRKADDLSKSLYKKYKTEMDRRDNFVEQLVIALCNPDTDKIQLTFIYGTAEQTNTSKESHNWSFLPLDGQQRLTTLFLLSWLLIHRLSAEQIDKFRGSETFSAFEKGLHSFNYKTRPTSGEFCRSLAVEVVTFKPEDSIGKQLENQSWFGDEWKKDPSVQAMLQMLDRLDEEIKGKNIAQMLENLVSGKGIEFDLLDMEDYKLSENLYIKMNARGKQLTEFENWKAEFIAFLDEKHKGVIYKGKMYDGIPKDAFGGQKPTLKDYFSYSIEHQWTDLFWKYCRDDIVKNNEKIANSKTENEKGRDPQSPNEDCYPVIDDYFMRVFGALTQILFYEFNRDKRDASDFDSSDRESWRRVYSKTESVEALFAYLDILCGFTEELFDGVFYVVENNQDTLQNCKVRLFDGKDVNLLTRCARGEEFTAESQTLLYALLKYVREIGNLLDVDMLVFVRLVRNRIGSMRTLRNTATMENDYFVHDLHAKKVSSCIDELIKDKQTEGHLKKYTVEEAAYEDFDFIRGNGKIRISNFSLAIELFKAWDSLGLIEKQRLLIAYGFRGHFVKSCGHGKLLLLGNDNRWEPVFAHDDKNADGAPNGNIDSVITAIAADYSLRPDGKTGVEALRTLLGKKLSFIPQAYGFAYYALKYDEFLKAHAKDRPPRYYISVNGDMDGLDINSVVYSPHPISAYHTDPIVYALKEQLIKHIVEGVRQDLYLYCSVLGQGSVHLQVYDNWKGGNLKAAIRHKPGTHMNGGWELIENGGNGIEGTPSKCDDVADKDRIQTGLAYVKSLFPHARFKEYGVAQTV